MRLFGVSRQNDDNFAQPVYEDYKNSGGNTKFFPSSVKPEIRGAGEVVKLNAKDAAQLEVMVGQSRKNLVAPYVNNMATFEGSDKHYSQLSEEEKINNLNILYEQGFKAGKYKFLQIHPEIKSQVTETDEQKSQRLEQESKNKALRSSTKADY